MNTQYASHPQDKIEDAISSIQDWLPRDEFCQRFPNIPQKTLNWQLTCRNKNGLAPYVQVIGKKLFMALPQIEWVTYP